MCRFKSGIILKDRIYIPDTDSHTDMLNELGIEDTRENAERHFVRYELIPPNDDYFAPINLWEYRVDQDILPGWYIQEIDEKRVREVMQAWAAKHIHLGKKKLILNERRHFAKDSTVTAYDNSTVTACGNSTVTACGSSTVKAYHNSTVKAYHNSTVEAYHNSTITACGSSTVTACGSSTVTACGSSTVTACGSSTVTACGNSTVTAYDNSTVTAYDDSTTVIRSKFFKLENCKVSGSAVMVDFYNKKIHCAGGVGWSLITEEG